MSTRTQMVHDRRHSSGIVDGQRGQVVVRVGPPGQHSGQAQIMQEPGSGIIGEKVHQYHPIDPLASGPVPVGVQLLIQGDAGAEEQAVARPAQGGMYAGHEMQHEAFGLEGIHGTGWGKAHCHGPGTAQSLGGICWFPTHSGSCFANPALGLVGDSGLVIDGEGDSGLGYPQFVGYVLEADPGIIHLPVNGRARSGFCFSAIRLAAHAPPHINHPRRHP